MSAVEQVSGGVIWTIDNVFNSRLKKSQPFNMQVNERNVSFTLSSIFIASEFLTSMCSYHEIYDNGNKLGRRSNSDQQVAIYVKSSLPIDLVPKFELKANDGSWYNLSINWFGGDGTTRDKRFFGSTKFMDEAELRANYVANCLLTIKCTVLPVILSDTSDLLITFAKIFEDGVQADIVLVSEDKELKVSKCILAGRSSVFAAMFEHKLDEVQSGIVNIIDVDYEPLRALVKFLYTGQIEVDDVELALKVFVAADKYDVQSLKNLVEDYIAKNITNASFIEAIHIAKTLKSDCIKTACLNLIAKMKKSDCMAIPDFNELDRELFIEVVGIFCETINGQ